MGALRKMASLGTLGMVPWQSRGEHAMAVRLTDMRQGDNLLRRAERKAERRARRRSK